MPCPAARDKLGRMHWGALQLYATGRSSDYKFPIPFFRQDLPDIHVFFLVPFQPPDGRDKDYILRNKRIITQIMGNVVSLLVIDTFPAQEHLFFLFPEPRGREGREGLFLILCT